MSKGSHIVRGYTLLNDFSGACGVHSNDGPFTTMGRGRGGI